MKNNIFFSIFFLLLFYQASTCQENKYIDSVYTKYFQNTREIPYLHLNKTSFLKGEEIWFQAYIVEQNSGKPHPTTSNLYVSIFDETGKMKKQHLILIKNGIGKGNILIDSTYSKSKYYIKASTNWMKNFKEDNAYYQKIEVISTKHKTNKASVKKNIFFDFQLFPEGGHFLSNVNNSIGILIKDKNNNGLKIINGTIKDSYNKIIGTFKTNKFGVGKTSCFLKRNESYIFEAALPNGNVLSKKVEKTRSIGILLKTENDEKNVKVILETNPSTLNLLKEKTFKIFIHNSKQFKTFKIPFKTHSYKYILMINKKELSKGINIVTLFNDKEKIISERLIYNDSKDLFTNIIVAKQNLNKDSISINITNNSNEKIFISTSFLPNKTKVYNSFNNIKSSVLLKPYIRGKIENPQYYFNTKNKNRLLDLDLLLLTQGWSKFEWKNIFNSKQVNNFDFEKGIDLTIHLNKRLRKKENLLVYSPENGIIRVVSPDRFPFIYKNTFIKKGSKIKFSLKRNDKLSEITPTLSYSSNKISDYIESKHLLNKEFLRGTKEFSISNFNALSKGREVLDEVVIVSNKKFDNETKGISNAFKKMNFKELPFSNGSLIQFIEPIYEQYKYSRHYLGVFYLNGEIVSSTNSLYGISMDEVREIRMGTSIFGSTREMHIYTYSLKELDKLKIKSVEINLPVGFQKSKEYYSPKYPSFTNDTYINYGAIYWKSNIFIAPFSKSKFNVSLNNQKKIKLYVEGISESGKLISITKILKSSKKYQL